MSSDKIGSDGFEMPALDIDNDLELAELHSQMFVEAVERLGGDKVLMKLGPSFMMSSIYLKLVLSARLRGVVDYPTCREIAIAQLDSSVNKWEKEQS